MVVGDGDAAELAVWLDAMRAELRARVDAATTAAGVDDRALAEVLGSLEHLTRTTAACGASVVDTVDRRSLHALDGHRSTSAWIAASVRVPRFEATRRVRVARLLRDHPQIATLLADGTLGVDQVRELARAAANPRCGDLIGPALTPLLDAALHTDYDVFATLVRSWEELADQDGAHRDHDTAHRGRRASVVTVGDTTLLRAEFANLQGDAIRQILAGFTDAEYLTNRDNGGTRTPQQRAADALFNIFVTAAGAPVGGKDSVDVVVNIVVDEATFEQRLTDLIDPLHRHERRDQLVRPTSAVGAVGRIAGLGMCRLADGTPIDPTDAVVSALIGHVRRVVYGPDGVIIDLGRRSRCFTGSARVAGMLQAALDTIGRCSWPGCRQTHIQLDHLQEWRHGGTTTITNAGPACGHHNRLKATGYTTRRDPSGHWHHYRPDGTELTAA